MSDLGDIPKYQFFISGAFAAGFFFLTGEKIHDGLHADHPVPNSEGWLNSPVFGNLPGLLTSIMVTFVMISIIMSPIFLQRFSPAKRAVFIVVGITGFLAVLFAPELLERQF